MGRWSSRVRELVTALGLSEVVTFRKKTDYSEVPNDYRDADIFITTSISDGTPVSLLEAMASGLPCIATSVGGIPEWIEDKRSGLLIPRVYRKALQKVFSHLPKILHSVLNWEMQRAEPLLNVANGTS